MRLKNKPFGVGKPAPFFVKKVPIADTIGTSLTFYEQLNHIAQQSHELSAAFPGVHAAALSTRIYCQS